MAKQINYKLKYTKANTQYVTIDKTDHQFIINELKKITEYIDSCRIFDHPDINRIIYETTSIDKNLPRRGIKPYNYNSIYDYCSGILDNFNNKIAQQFNFTLKNLEPIEYITDYFETNIKNFTKIVFKRI